MIDALLAKEGEKSVEIQMALDINLQPVEWFSKAAWVRGIADLLILDGEIAWVVDYKTGSNKYPDRNQLDLMSLLVFAHYPEVQQVNSALLFVVKNSMIKHKVKREDVDKLWWEYRERVSRIEASHANEVWNPKQSGLCPWCPVKTCEFHPNH
jgi:RecB family exonuclease